MSAHHAHISICNEIADCANHLDWAVVDEFVGHVFGHGRIYILARGRTELALKMFAMRLTQMGCSVHVVGDVTSPAITESDLLLVASASGETVGVCTSAAKARGLGASVAAFVGRPDSTLAGTADFVVVVPAPSMLDTDRSQFGGSLFEQSLVLLGDAIVQSKLRGDPVLLKRMCDRHANLE